MGAWYLFECESCGYRAEVSGGDDVGMASRTTTVSCEVCRELYDVVISEEPWLAGRPDDKNPGNLQCPRSSEHRCSPWEHPGPCPKCGEQIRERGMTALWD